MTRLRRACGWWTGALHSVKGSSPSSPPPASVHVAALTRPGLAKVTPNLLEAPAKGGGVGGPLCSVPNGGRSQEPPSVGAGGPHQGPVEEGLAGQRAGVRAVARRYPQVQRSPLLQALAAMRYGRISAAHLVGSREATSRNSVDGPLGAALQR